MIEAYAQKMQTSAFMESPAASRVNFLHDHAIISDASYNTIMGSCAPVPADFNTRSDCREHRYVEPVGDELAECSYTRRGETHVRGPYNVSGCSTSEDRYARYYCDGDGGTPYWSCGVSPGHVAYDCCNAMDGYDDDIGDLDVYGLYEYCAADPEDNARRNGRQGNLTWSEEFAAERRFIEAMDGHGRYTTVDNELYGLGGCWGGTESVTQYLNRDDVRAAIHVKSRAEMTQGAGKCLC